MDAAILGFDIPKVKMKNLSVPITRAERRALKRKSNKNRKKHL